MQYPHYSILAVSKSNTTYLFLSEGSKGLILKVVQFAPTDEPNIVNLSLGDYDTDGIVRDDLISNNGDLKKVIATVVIILERFLEISPNKKVFFSGLTKSRNRLFRLMLSNYKKELNPTFIIQGLIQNGDENIIIPFEANHEYIGYLISIH
jgi:hypothetical protein